MNIKNILEEEGIYEYLLKRNLLSQYKKAKINILSKINTKSLFKERNPKGSNIWYFRINKKYRAYGSFDTDNDLLIYKISDHQE
ncbi:MAG: hypothetical protein PHS49_07300 [Candidatus Gracilibacteria bacterium]|nr:hypothetical protein [Candidatus Gracilibacteria bacterium]